MARERTQIIVEIGLSVAMAAVLYGVFHVWLPINAFGGEIALTMVPIMALALRRGVVAGVIAGALWGVLQAILEPQFVYYPAQALLDYPVAFGLVGLAGLGSPAYHRALAAGHRAAAGSIALAFSIIGATARFAAHVISGVMFFAANAPAGQPVLIYSILYNGAYLVPSAILSCVATVVVLLALEAAIPSTASPATPSGSA